MYALGIAFGIAALSAIMVLGTVVPNVLAISDPDQRSARDFAPGQVKDISDPNEKSANDFAPGHSEIGDPNSVAPGTLKKIIKPTE